MPWETMTRFYVFPGKRWIDTLLEGAPPGFDDCMSESGLSNTDLFINILQDTLQIINVGQKRPATLFLYDGHKSHMSLILTI